MISGRSDYNFSPLQVTRYDAIGSGRIPYTLCMTEDEYRATYAKIKGSNCTMVTSWSHLPSGVAIDEKNSTLRRVAGIAGGRGNIYRVSWADTKAGYGGSWGQLGRLTLMAGSRRKCLFISMVDGSWQIKEGKKCVHNRS